MVTVPTAGNSATFTFSGTIPAGTHPNSSCGAVPSDPTLDSTNFVVSVPANLYTTATAVFAFSITWTPVSGNETTNDEVLTLVGPSGEIASSDGSTTTEALSQKNLAAATYTAEACGFANSVAQPYTGTLVITTTTNPPAPPGPTPVTDPITFGVPTVMDPIHPFGEPDIGVDAAGHVYASGPAGTGTQRSFWEASVDGGATFRPIHQSDFVIGTSDAPGGGDTDIAFDHHSPQGQYFSDLYALACTRVAATHDGGNTTSENVYPGGCAGNPPEVDRQWYAVWDPVGVTTSTAYTGTFPLIYNEYGPAPSHWTKSSDGLTFTNANATTHFGADGYPAIDQVTGDVFEATYSGSTIKLNVGVPDAAGNLTFLDDTGGNNIGNALTTVATGVINSGDVANFVVTSMDSARNLYVFWVGRSATPSDRQVWVSAASAANKWKTWTTPVQVSDGSASTGDHVNVFPWGQAGGAGRADAVWYGDSSSLDPSSTSSGHVWNVFMNQVVFPVDGTGAVTGAAPAMQLVKVTPHPMDYLDVCLSGTGCITSQGNRNLADFFQVKMDNSGAAEIVYDDMSNGLINLPFSSSNPADHAGAALVTIARQNGGLGLLGTDVPAAPSVNAAPIAGLNDPSGDALFPVLGGANQPAMDLLSNHLSLSGSTLTVTFKVSDLTPATLSTDMSNMTGSAFLQYVTRWQMGNTIYYAMMETDGALRTAGQDQFYAGKAQSIDLCSVSACDPHVLFYPEAGPGANNETGSINCPTTPSATNPCTVTITVNAADVGTPTGNSLLEEVGTYSFESTHLQASIDVPQAQADNVPREIDGICCFNFSANLNTSVPEGPWTPALIIVGATLVIGGLTRRRFRRTRTTLGP